MSRVQQAITLVEQGMPVRDAAAKVQISPSSIYAGMKLRRLRQMEMHEQGLQKCPVCNGSGHVQKA